MDYSALINPKPEMSPRAETTVDFLSWVFPVLAAICSIAAGITALQDADMWAAGLGIAGGVTGAFGVIFTNIASRIRDRRLAVAHSLGALGADLAQNALDRSPMF